MSGLNDEFAEGMEGRSREDAEGLAAPGGGAGTGTDQQRIHHRGTEGTEEHGGLPGGGGSPG